MIDQRVAVEGAINGVAQPVDQAVQDLDALNVTEVIEQDSRPTFILDLDPHASNPVTRQTAISPIFCNSALRLHQRLLEQVTGVSDDEHGISEGPTYADFRSWATAVTRLDDSKDVFPLSFIFCGKIWTSSTVRRRWRLISGNLGNSTTPPRNYVTPANDPQLEGDRGALHEAKAGDHVIGSTAHARDKNRRTSSISASNIARESAPSSLRSQIFQLAAPESVVSDWTARHPQGILTPHQEFARSIRWEDTSLGPMDQWPSTLRQAANIVMKNPFQAALFWGNDLNILYNERYAAQSAGSKHPHLMGTRFSDAFSESWEYVSHMFTQCAQTGVAVRRDNDCVPINRHGYLEETYFCWSLQPLYGNSKQIVGFYNSLFETTQSVLSNRRMRTINTVGEKMADMQTIEQFWRSLLEGLEENEFDVPFALVYSVTANREAIDVTSVSRRNSLSHKTCRLQGSLGIPKDHPEAPQQFNLKRSQASLAPSFREAMCTGEPTLLSTMDGTLPEALLENVKWRGFGDPCRQAIIFPVRPINGDGIRAFLLLGVNPRRPYDADYQAFTNLLSRQMNTSLATFLLWEGEVARNRNAAEAAAFEQEQLSQQLRLQTTRLRRMTELSPLGMFLLSPTGLIREGNDKYYEMTGDSRENGYEMSWMELLVDSSRKVMQDGWRRLVNEKLPFSQELQLKRLGSEPVDLKGDPIEFWVMVNAQPELAPDGSVISVMGSITEISHLKWAQAVIHHQLQEAEERRRQQNEFIDITSHEMRNPLSAILQCADDIISTLEARRHTNTTLTRADLEGCLEAAHTISLCVQHQKSIVDDILTVSKLDANLLVITPTASQPIQLVQRAARIFEPEMRAKDIKMVCEMEPTLKEMSVNWVNLDPSRVLQVLINLVTNAIKFTDKAPERRITISVGASRNPPQPVEPEFAFIPTKCPNPTVVKGDDWGTGEIIHIYFKVRDTGCGLTKDEIKVLFERFSQASPRTHVQYGGSGLGLFISRQMAELHGGQIGVASQASKGSVFGFFITARRSENQGTSEGDESHSFERGVKNISLEPRTPQRQDLASPNLVAGLLASKARPALVPGETEILVVEDNLVNQKVLVKQLKKVGFGVSAVNDGIEALAFLEGTAFCRPKEGRRLSVVLMDLEMPRMDGLSCVREIRNMESRGLVRGHVPVIAVTANVRDEQIASARASGMDDVVSKPFKIADLMAKIATLLFPLPQECNGSSNGVGRGLTERGRPRRETT
ncbi:aerobic respiration control sensor protein arcB [Xylariomycetidae sp. FL2044]|nr:aerobic respiration control sensor protein arcB [Xylariomycetidae sp. FL2044]